MIRRSTRPSSDIGSAPPSGVWSTSGSWLLSVRSRRSSPTVRSRAMTVRSEPSGEQRIASSARAPSGTTNRAWMSNWSPANIGQLNGRTGLERLRRNGRVFAPQRADLRDGCLEELTVASEGQLPGQ